MDQLRPNFLSGPYIDRRAEAREDGHWIAQARADRTTRYLLGQGSAQLLTTGSEPRIAFLDHDSPLVRAAPERVLLLLGWLHDTRIVLIDMPVSREP